MRDWTADEIKSIADRLRRARIGAGFERATDAVRKFGWSYSRYMNYENGERAVPPKQAILFAAAYGVTVDYIYFGKGHILNQNEGMYAVSSRMVRRIPLVALENMTDLQRIASGLEPTAAESAQQRQEYHASARRLDDMFLKANPGQPAVPAMNFDRLVQSLYMTAAVQMGAGTGPNEQPRIDIVGARQSIDMLIVLEEKTKGNISEQEKSLLQNALFDLRMSFLEITNAIASSAQRPPQPKKPH